MQITKLKLVNFRNFTNQEFEFSKYKNIIIGKNGIGKSNIIEAIYYLALTKSFRTFEDSVLIKENEMKSIIEGDIKNKYNYKFKIALEKSGKKAFIDNKEIGKLSDYISKINIVMFSQEDLKLIKDSPSVHRKLINMEISQLDNNYLKLLSNYNKVLKQRNTYLKSMQTNSMIPKEYLEILTNKLIDLGIQISDIRSSYVDNINLSLDVIFNKITKRNDLSLKYVSEYKNLNKEKLLKKYKNNFMRDLNYGKTNIGIHLDDFIFYYKEHLAKNFLSDGEQKNAIISYKLSAIDVFYNKTKTMPILILDDLFSELDREKINRIIRFLKKTIQIFITTTDLNEVSERILKNSRVFKLTTKKIEVRNYE